MTPKKDAPPPAKPLPTHGGEYVTNPETGEHEPAQKSE
jgi:hypothetical protein